MGIGRGTDLILYVWILISSAILLILYLNARQQFQVITVLARTIALRDAEVRRTRSERPGARECP